MEKDIQNGKPAEPPCTLPWKWILWDHGCWVQSGRKRFLLCNWLSSIVALCWCRVPLRQCADVIVCVLVGGHKSLLIKRCFFLCLPSHSGCWSVACGGFSGCFFFLMCFLVSYVSLLILKFLRKGRLNKAHSEVFCIGFIPFIFLFVITQRNTDCGSEAAADFGHAESQQKAFSLSKIPFVFSKQNSM